MKDSRVPLSPCPECGKIHDGALSVHGDYVPKPGDLTVCSNCGAALMFGLRLTLTRADLTKLTVHEVNELATAAALVRAAKLAKR